MKTTPNFDSDDYYFKLRNLGKCAGSEVSPCIEIDINLARRVEDLSFPASQRKAQKIYLCAISASLR